MHFKTFMGCVLSAVLLCASPIAQTAAKAAEPYGIVSPLYEIADVVWTDLTISGTTATCKGSVESARAVKITCEQYLQKQGFLWIWTTYDDAEWTETEYSNCIAVLNTKTGLTSGKYRLKTIFTLTDKQGKSEKITDYSSERTVG